MHQDSVLLTHAPPLGWVSFPRKTWVSFNYKSIQNLTWPLDPKLTDPVLCGLLFPNQKAKVTTSKRMPDYAHIRKELLRNGVNKKLLWTEYRKRFITNRIVKLQLL